MAGGFGGYKAFAIGVLALVTIGMSGPDASSNLASLRTQPRPTKILDFAAAPESGFTRLFSGLFRRPTPGRVQLEPLPTEGGTAPAAPGSDPAPPNGATNPLYSEETAIPSNFDTSSYLVPAWGSGAIPPDNGADPVGAFRFICGGGQVRYDDPIVYPGQPGDSHLHQFYGNTAADAYSTYSSLRQTGNSTCGDPLNRSGYWMPALLDGRGHVVQPDYVSIYYKRLPASDPHCNDPSRTDLQAEGICVPIPNGIRFIFGYDMLTGTPRTGGNQFMCVAGNNPTGTYETLRELAAAGCAAGNHVELMISAPTCWDGKHLDSPNHRDHVAYPSYGGWGYLRCDAAHPYVMPRFQMSVFYTIAKGDDLKLWHLSSDEMMPGIAAGTTFHADYFEGWDNKVMAMWMDNCINKHLNCSGGDLGNGSQLRGAAQPSYGWSNPNRLVPVPAR
jgi:hypothetical protein